MKCGQLGFAGSLMRAKTDLRLAMMTMPRLRHFYTVRHAWRSGRLFEAITLPCVAAQTDPDFTFLIVTRTGLPTPYLERLRGLTAAIPQCRIVQYPPRPHRRAMKNAINDWRAPPMMRLACNFALMMMTPWPSALSSGSSRPAATTRS